MSVPPVYARLGLRVIEVGEGAATVELGPGDGDEAHLALIAAVAQAAIEQAIGSTVDPAAQRAFQFDLNLSRVRPLAGGVAARAVASVVHRGRTTAVASCRVTAGPDRTLIATASGTASIGPR